VENIAQNPDQDVGRNSGPSPYRDGGKKVATTAGRTTKVPAAMAAAAFNAPGCGVAEKP
jgi:hypothetical protein